MHRRNGFALLEALVALVIVAGVGTALFALINTGLQNLGRAEAHVAVTTLQPQILAWVRSAELSELPASKTVSTEFRTGDKIFTATAEFDRFQGPTFATTASGTMGIHQVALYDVAIEVRSPERLLDTLFTRRAASKQVMDAPQF
jgi:Tfp pilus assembly protein PilV